MRSSSRISLGFASNHHHLSQVFGRLTVGLVNRCRFFSRGHVCLKVVDKVLWHFMKCGGGEIFGSPWTAECFGKCHEREKENPCRVVFLSQGVIKLRILWWSNDTNVWWIWGISLELVSYNDPLCHGPFRKPKRLMGSCPGSIQNKKPSQNPALSPKK